MARKGSWAHTKAGDFTKCYVCKASEDDVTLYITPNQFTWQFSYCLEHFIERVGSYPGLVDASDLGPDYEPHDLDA